MTIIIIISNATLKTTKLRCNLCFPVEFQLEVNRSAGRTICCFRWSHLSTLFSEYPFVSTKQYSCSFQLRAVNGTVEVQLYHDRLWSFSLAVPHQTNHPTHLLSELKQIKPGIANSASGFENIITLSNVIATHFVGENIKLSFITIQSWKSDQANVHGHYKGRLYPSSIWVICVSCMDHSTCSSSHPSH